MKRRTTLLLALALLGATGAVQALPSEPVAIFADEHGHGFFVSPFVGPAPLFFALADDPGPGGQANVLTYDLGGPPSLVAGDVFLTEPGSADISDIIRFNPAGTGGNPRYPATFIIYSDPDDKVPSLADGTPFPTSFYTNTVTLEEQGSPDFNGIQYHPTSGQPGFVDGFDVQYLIISDGVLVPEPGPVAVLAMGGVLGVCLVITARRRARAQQAA